MSEAEARLFALLDKAMAEPGAVPIAAIQEASVQVPHLSSRLTGWRRYQLYCCLLLDKPPAAIADTFQSHVEKADDNHKAVAAQLKEILCDGEQPDDSELQGFVALFAFKTGCHFDEEMTAITLTLATMLAAAGLPAGTEKLRLLYQLLEALYKDFVVRNTSHVFDGSLEPLFRLLLQYHDPIFSLHLDQRLVNIGVYLLNWVRRLFVGKKNHQQALIIWDWFLIVGDPTLTVYLAISYLIAHRQRFLALQTKEELTEALESLVFVLPKCKEETVDHALNDGRPLPFVSLSSGKSLAQNADIAYRKTPRSARRVIDHMLFPGEGILSKSPEALAGYYTSWVALPLERSDFEESFSTKAEEQADSAMLSYIVVDCRSRESFHFARLPTAMHVGDDIGYESEKLRNVVIALGSVRGAHLCVFGTGRSIVEEANLLKVLSLHLVHCGFPYISIGGFRSIIPLIKARAVTISRTPKGEAAWGYVSGSASALKNSLTEILPQLDFDTQEALRKAEELGSKAKDRVLAAKSWGWDMVQRVGERLARNNISNNNNNNGGDGNSSRSSANQGSHSGAPHQKGSASSSAASAAPNGAEQLLGHRGGRVGGENARRRRSVDAGSVGNTFSLGVDDDDDDDEDDFGLITSVPVYAGTTASYHDGEPLFSGTVVGDSSPTLTPSRLPAGVAPSPRPSSSSSSPSSMMAAVSKDIVAEIDEEFDKLFGDSEEP